MKIKKRITIFLTIIALLGLAIFMFLQTEVFGQNPKGADLERIKKSPHYRDGKFQNEHFTPNFAEDKTAWDMVRAFTKVSHGKEPDFVLPSVKTDLKKLSDTAQIVWFGHSSYLIHINGKNILVDPVFSGHASPFWFAVKNFEGSNVYSVEDMPAIDVLIITHDHYDHLDYQTVKKLQPKVNQVVTSLGVGSHLKRWGYAESQIHELDWDDNVVIDSVLSFTAQPARHFAGRGLKRNQTFWSSFVLKTPTHNLFLGGDSGYDTHFKTIGQKYGPFDLAILECGQYNEIWKYIHTMPEETALAATELRAKALLPVHWSKFSLALHPWNEPIERVTKAAEKLGLPLVRVKIGEQSPLTPEGGIEN
jgi:L-ascorbate metabolism protein UlaG (beta-lactamase superfamily)